MDDLAMYIFIGLLLLGVLIVFITFFRYILRESMKKMRISTFFGLKSARVKFKRFDSFVSHSLFVSRKREYEVVYRVDITNGTIYFNLDDQLEIETSSRVEGSKILSFSRFKPIIFFRGEKAQDGECSIKLYKIK